jgi:hypothetical protein
VEILLTLLNLALPTIATAIGIILIALLRKGLKKLGLEENRQLDDMIDRYVQIGVNAAEKKATNAIKEKLATMSPEQKLESATAMILAELEAAGIKDVGPALIKTRIESYLNMVDPKV